MRSLFMKFSTAIQIPLPCEQQILQQKFVLLAGLQDETPEHG